MLCCYKHCVKYRNFAQFTQNFDTRKLGKIMAFYALKNFFHIMFLSCHIRWVYLNVKELLTRIRSDIWRLSNSNGTWNHKNLVCKQTFHHLGSNPVATTFIFIFLYVFWLVLEKKKVKRKYLYFSTFMKFW